MRPAGRPLTQLGAWPVRVTWLLLPLLAGPPLADALDTTSRPMQVVTSTGLWVTWLGLMVATLLPSTASLTLLRVGTPAATTALGMAVAKLVADSDQVNGWHVAAAAWSTATILAAFLPSTGAVFVNGSSYGDELRMPLRVPGPLLLGPIPLAWAVTVAGAVTSPLLLAARQWVAGGLALAVGLLAVWWGVRVLHRLSRRWAIFVPGGLVLHDPLALADPVLFRRTTIASLGPAPAGTSATDLTCGALGLAVEARFVAPVSLVRASRPGSPAAEAFGTDAVLFTPTQPGALLTEARERNLGRGT